MAMVENLKPKSTWSGTFPTELLQFILKQLIKHYEGLGKLSDYTITRQQDALVLQFAWWVSAVSERERKAIRDFSDTSGFIGLHVKQLNVHGAHDIIGSGRIKGIGY